ncbi:MAG: carbohydrate ABC transporter permease [Fimbriimonas sp.]|nr:carbohydrate ABC transporter permease [Fimbriimonas sp.]
MPLIPVVGRHSFKMRLVAWSIYLALTVLGIGMVYPFLMTLTASVSGPMDYDRYAPIPRSLLSREERFVGGLSHYFPDTMRNGMLMFSTSFENVPDTWTTWKSVGDDEQALDRFARNYLTITGNAARFAGIKRQAADYDVFASTYPLSDSICSFDEQIIGPFFRDCYRQIATAKRGSGSLDDRALALMSRDWGIPLDTFYAFKPDREFQAPWDQTNFLPFTDGRAKSFEWLWLAYRDREFLPESMKSKSGLAEFPSALAALSPSNLTSIDPRWQNFTENVVPMCETRPYPMKMAWLRFLGSDDARVKLGIGGGGPITIREYNRAFGAAYRHLRETPFPIDPPGVALPSKLTQFWAEFKTSEYPRRLIEVRISPAIQDRFRTFAKLRSHGDLARLNLLLESHYRTWNEVNIAPRVPVEKEAEASLWMDFIGQLPLDALRFHSAEADYQEFLLRRYGSIEAVDRAYGWNLKDIRQAEMPLDAAYLVTFAGNEVPLYVSSLTRNYRFVFDYLFNRDQAVTNTAILIVLSLIAVLTVNPLAAYALSRFQMSQTAAIILYLLATMSFPTVVSMIPGFLLMRDLHLLNTYAALILPGLANGFSIFLLKGFFDSLPAELYEAATLDGAPEWQIFYRITRPLSTPILAVIALNCFMATYAAWEWALVVCQKQSMWTLSVWLYKFTVDWAAQPWLVMASFVIASIPVFLVFLLCQNVILRGIILPQMK